MYNSIERLRVKPKRLPTVGHQGGPLRGAVVSPLQARVWWLWQGDHHTDILKSLVGKGGGRGTGKKETGETEIRLGAPAVPG